MPLHHVSSALTQRVPILYFEQHRNVKEICRILGIKKTLVYKTLGLYRKYGSITNPNTDSSRSGRARLLSGSDTAWLRQKLASNRAIYLDELQLLLARERNRHVSLSTVQDVGMIRGGGRSH